MTHQQALAALASERYLLNEMSEIERYAFEEHYFECEICAEDVRVGAVMREGVRDGLIGDGLIGSGMHTDRILPWAVAASLAVAVGYQQFVAGPPRVDPQALSPITLRSSARGSDPIVRVGSTGFATFAVDIDSRGSGSELTYALRNPAGTQVASGRLPAPAQGAPLLLLIPASTVSAAGRYVLEVRDAAGANEYAFVVTSTP